MHASRTGRWLPMSFDVTFDPAFLATRRGDEDALLVLSAERLAAILVRMTPETNDAGEAGWWLEVGPRPRNKDGLTFPTLTAPQASAREVVGGELGVPRGAAS